MLYELFEFLTSTPAKRFALKTYQFGPALLNIANPTGTEILDRIDIPDPNDGAYLLGFDFNTRQQTANIGISNALDELDDWTVICRWNESDLINKVGTAGVNVIQAYVRNVNTITFGTAGNKIDFASGRIPIMSKVGPGGKIEIGVKKRAGGGTNNWWINGILYYGFFPYYQLPGNAIPGSVAR